MIFNLPLTLSTLYIIIDSPIELHRAWARLLNELR